MPPDTSDLDPKQPSPGDNPAGDVSAEPAPTGAADGSAGTSVAAGSSDETDVLDVDEIDELDVVEEPVEAAPPAPPPPPPGGTVRTAAPPPPKAPAPVSVEDLAAPPPLEQRLARPTVLEQVVEDVKKGDWERRAKELLRDLDTATDRRQVGAIAYELGDFYERRVGDEARAVKAYGRALQSDPSLRPNLWAIRRVFYRRNLWPNLIKLLDAEIRFARDDGERADLHIEKAQILEDKLEDAEAAKQAYLAAAGLDPSNVTALVGVERIALADGDNVALAKAWRGLADAVGHPSRKVAYLLDLSRLQSNEGDAGIDRATETMREAGEIGVDVRYITRERLRLAELSNDPHALLEALEAQITDLLAQYGPSGPPDGETSAPTGEPSAPLDRGTTLRLQMVALRRRQARVAVDQLADADRAWDYLTRALRVTPGEPLIMADLADVAEKLGKFDALAQLCQGWESLEGDATRSLSLSLRRADALLRSGDRQQADELLTSLGSAAPGYLPITALRERDALDQRDWAALARTYESAAEAARLGTTFGPGSAAKPDATSAAAFYVSAGDLHATLAGDLDAAHAAYGQALEAQAAYAPAVEALTTLYEQTGRFDEAVSLLEAQAKAAAADDKTALRGQLLERLADLYDRLGRLEPLIETLSELLALHPTSKALRWRLDAALRLTDRHADRVDVLGRLARAEDDPNKRAAVLVEAGRLCEHALDDKERAATLYREVLEAVPSDRYARTALVALLRSDERWDDLVAERKAEADFVEDGPSVGRALREAAWVLREKLGKPKEAADLYRDLLDRVPDDPFALRGLADALEAAGDTDALAEVLEREAGAQTEAAAQAAAYLRLGGFLERHDRAADALEAYRSANEADPERTLAAVCMYELAVRSGDLDAQVEALRLLAVHRPSQLVRAELLEEIGWLGALRAEDYDRAAGSFQAAIAAGSSRVGPRLGNSLVQARRAEMDELGDALGELAAAVDQPTAAAALLLRAAAVAEVAGDRDRANARLSQALAVAPDHPGVLVAAAEHLPLDPLRDQRAGSTADAEPGGAIDAPAVYRGRAKLAGDTMARQDWSLDAAEMLEHGGRLAEAGQLVAAVLRERPDDVRALELLRRICRRGDDRKSLAAASLALARIVGDPAGKLELLREAAAIYDSELHQAEAAVAVYRRILSDDPGAGEFERLRAIYREHDDVAGLIGLIGDRLKWLDQADTGSQPKVPLLLERGRLRNKIGDVQGAARDLAALYEIDTRNADALREQAQVMLQLGDHGNAVKRLERYLEVELDPEKRGWAELTLSQVLAENMDDIAGAIEQLEHVIALSPDDIDVRERLIGLVMKAKDFHRAVREIRELKRLRNSSAERARDELRIAAVCRDQLKDSAKAKQALERARQLDPLNIDAIRDLAALASDSDEKKQVLRHAASDIRAKIAETPERGALYDRLSVVAQWQNTEHARFLALEAVDALGALSADQRRFVESRRKALDALIDVPTTAITAEDWRTLLAHPGDGGFAAELWAVIADAATKLMGVDSSRLGFSRADRASIKSAARAYPSLARGLECFGAGNVELYISESKSAYARVVSAAKPVLYLSADAAKAHTAQGRFLLGRALAHVRCGTGTVAHMRNDELVLLFAAAARAAGVNTLPDSLAAHQPDAGAVTDRAKALHKQLGRRERKGLALLASKFSELADPVQWRSAVMSTASRAGLLLAGDISVGLDVLDVGRGGRSLKDDPAALTLLGWAVGDDHAALRRKLAVVKRA